MLAAFSNVVISCGVDGEDSSLGSRLSVCGKAYVGLLIQRSSYKQINGRNDDDVVGSSLNRQHVETVSCALKSSGPTEEAEVGKSASALGSGRTT